MTKTQAAWASSASNRVLLKLKGLLFAFYWLIPVIASLAIVSMVLTTHFDTSVVGAIVGGCFGFCYFIQKQKLEEATFFRNVFTDFNTRYDNLNDDLIKVLQSGKIEAGKEAKLIDYFNLCAEEYLVYKMGYIPLEVWESWLSGMYQYWSIPLVKTLWKSEISTGSYYGFDPEKELAQNGSQIAAASDQAAA